MEEKEGAYFLEKKSRLNPLLILLNPSRYFFLLWSLDYNVQAFFFFTLGLDGMDRYISFFLFVTDVLVGRGCISRMSMFIPSAISFFLYFDFS